MENENNALGSDFKHIFALLKRWLWLIILCIILGAIAGFVLSTRQTPIYRASTKVLTSRAESNQTADVTASLTSSQLAQTYVELLKTESVAKTVIKRLGIDLSPAGLQGNISVSVLNNTQIIKIDVEDANPQQAALIANTLVTVLIEQNDVIQAGRYISMEESLQSQKTQIETQIANLQNQIDQTSVRTVDEQKKWIEQQIADLQSESSSLQAEMPPTSVPGKPAPTPATPEERALLDQKQARLDQIRAILALYQQSYSDLIVYGKAVPASDNVSDSQLTLLKTTQTLYQQIYISLLSSLESVRRASLQNTPNVVQIETASTPQTPIRPNIQLNTLLSGLAGLILAASAVFLIDFLDDTLKTPEDIERALGLTVVGSIADMRNNEKEIGVYVAHQPRSPMAESFRSLRTNIEFLSMEKPLKTILVTSATPEDGKTTTAANLAAVFAQGGQKVTLLDADLRRPSVHRALGMPNQFGLTDLFRDGLNAKQVSNPQDGNEMLSVITSGRLPPNPTELLRSGKMLDILKELSAEQDIIVIDSPPILVAADAQVLASRTDGVLLVIQSGKTSVKALRVTLEQMKRAGACILGVVLNRVPRNRGGYYDGYQHYKGYHYDGEQSLSSSTPKLSSFAGAKRKSNQEVKK